MSVYDIAGFAFSPIVSNLNPTVSVIIISFIVSLLITLAHKFLTNQALLKQTKEEMEYLRKEIKKNKDNQEKMMELNSELLKKSSGQFKNTFKVTLITFAPIILILGWMQRYFGPMGKILNLGIANFGWLGTYIIFSIIFTILIRKIMKVY